MKQRIVLPMCLCLLAWSAVPAPAGESDESARQTARRLDRRVRVQMDYLLSLPPDYEEQETWPLLLFLHGAGERGDDLELVKKHGPPKLIAEGKEFPFLVVSPQCPEGRWWQPFRLSALLDEIVEKHKVDPERIYVTGLSMGGFGTWALAAHSPDRFAAIVPICGGGDPFATRRYRDLPVWAFHGGEDPVVPVERSEEMVEALKERGGDAKLTVYPEAGHDSWTKTYENPELYEWLLQQRRSSESGDD